MSRFPHLTLAMFFLFINSAQGSPSAPCLSPATELAFSDIRCDSLWPSADTPLSRQCVRVRPERKPSLSKSAFSILQGAFTFQGSMIDMPLLKQAQNIVTLATAVKEK